MYCKECGFQLSDDAKFCPNCGTKVELNGVSDIKQKAVFGGIEKDDETNIDSVNEKANLEKNQEQEVKVSKVPKTVKRTKIIRTDKTTSPNIFVNYYSYKDDKSSRLSFYWYADSNGTIMSEKFHNLSLTIINNATMVQDIYENWACARFEYDNNYRMKLKITTEYVFDYVDTFTTGDGKDFFWLNYNNGIYGYDGDAFYKIKKRIDIRHFLEKWLIAFLVIAVIGIGIFLLIGLISGLFGGLSLKESLDAPIDDAIGYTVMIIIGLISIIGASLYVVEDKSSYTYYELGDKLKDYDNFPLF